MARFAYELRDAAGHSRTGVVQAEDIEEASRALRKPGTMVLDIHPERAEDAGLHATRRVKRDEVIFFANQLAVMVDTGVILTEALDAIAQQTENPTFQAIVRDLSDDVKGGEEFSRALEKFPKVFSGLFVALMKASEASGTMGTMLVRISGYLTQEREIRKQIKGAMTYPLCMLGFCVLVVVGMLVFILPRFEKIYAGKGAVLPLPTRFLLALSGGLIAYWPIILIGLAGGGVLLYLYVRSPAGRYAVDKMRISVPLIGRMYRKAYLARTLRTMGAMMTSGVSVLEGLEITARAAGNDVYARIWRDVAEEVKEGATISECLYNCKRLPRTIVQMLDAGERTGKLGLVMNRVAAFCEADLKVAVKTMTGMIEPAMIIIMGFIIGGIAMALLLPIFSLSKIIAH